MDTKYERFAIRPEDEYVIKTLRVFGAIKVIKDEAITEEPFLRTVLDMIKCFPSSYDGPLGPQALAGVKFVARQLGDIYNPQLNKTRRILNQDYFTLISTMASKEKYLIAFDETWVLGGIRNYNDTFKVFNIDQVDVYRFNKTFMVFAPVSAIVQEHILMWLYQNWKLFNGKSCIANFEQSPYYADDFRMLFPVNVEYVGNICLIESTLLSQKQLEAAYYETKMIYRIEGLNMVKATYAVFMTMWNTNFEYPMSWTTDQLSIWNAGYIGSEDLKAEFMRCLLDIEKGNIIFEEIPGPIEAATVTRQLWVRTFPCESVWYGAFTSNIRLNQVDFNEMIPYTDIPYDIVNGLLTDKSRTLRVLKMLGYSFTPDPIEVSIPIGYQTIQINSSDIITTYYYVSTHGQRVDVYTISGYNNPRILLRLQDLSNKGYFLSPKAAAIIRRYPKLVLSVTANIPNIVSEIIKKNLNV